MKKKFLYIISTAICCITFIKCYSQTFKIGVFDIDSMVHALPEYRVIDSLLILYEVDTAQTEYDILRHECKKTDSIFLHSGDYKYDKKFWDSISLARHELTIKLIYWTQIVKGKKDERERRFSEPLYQKVRTAFEKVVKEKKYDLVLKPCAIQFGNNVDNIFILVAKELNLTSVPAHLLQSGNLSNLVNPH